ncbi:enoyl-CoA hydratase/isomerase family protein [Nitrobacter sp.]|uniref:enoyl-CoA hydratase/isomerase family protein n=1 Tax=Nitrobacter sp. TaxID=29420 RepID=UPI0029CAC2FE|nr:enoyl-CoA hydratase-related protein [Nitrobacter sp.]
MTRLPRTSVLRLRLDGRHLTATIDDPSTRNAMSEPLRADLMAVLGVIEDDVDDIRSLVLTGAHRLFCAGADLKGDVRAETAPDGSDPITALSREGGALFHRLNACRVPVIAAVDGPAFGGGLGLACCADIVLCGPGARFALSETRLGLIPAQIAPFVLARIGLPAARRLALTGRSLGPAEAAAVGLADAAFEHADALSAAVDAYLDDIGRCAPIANHQTKLLLLSLGQPNQDDVAFIDRAATLFAEALRCAEGIEGIHAFSAKRKPDWTE